MEKKSLKKWASGLLCAIAMTAAAIGFLLSAERPGGTEQTKGTGGEKDAVTVLVYMNGSDLESVAGQASEDIGEMLAAETGENVNLLLETLGTKEWSDRYPIASDRSGRFRMEGGELLPEDDSLGQLDCTEPETLTDFIRWGAEKYPAERYILILWDHGAGPVYGFGYDEYRSEEEMLTIGEMREAVSESGVYFDFIGMDCCLMSSLELCFCMRESCDYMILSEDFETSLGWAYTDWLKRLEENPLLPTRELGIGIVDDMIAANAAGGEKYATLALIETAYTEPLYHAWLEFAYANEKTLLASDQSMYIRGGNRAHPILRRDTFDYDLAWYRLADMRTVAQSAGETENAETLLRALEKSIVHFACTAEESGMTGLSVTLPYGDGEMYEQLRITFSEAGLDAAYIDWLGKFVEADAVAFPAGARYNKPYSGTGNRRMASIP